MLTNVEVAKLERITKRKKMPVSTLAYRLLADDLRKTR